MDLLLFINNSARRSISAQRGFHVLHFRVKCVYIATYYITIFEREHTVRIPRSHLQSFIPLFWNVMFLQMRRTGSDINRYLEFLSSKTRVSLKRALGTF